ncbi:carboxypeptidase-like regulatory domain-containing protein [Flavobacterium gelidilacus]|uniref:TonB-dependent receptor n=1 Tax=Flavobacterium gelidilacus TaxID=206041 RepID=UPI0003F63423|nr:carboxypeptidase-like regulatory domain-containing protein [Flavobacterium gelidilacus]
MKNFTNVCLILITMLSASSLFAQTKITGIIMDGEFNESLAGANVFVKGTQVGTTTDLDGKFELTTTETSGTLVVSFLGFETKSVSFNAATKSIDLGSIQLNPDANQLTEVVLVGKGIIDLAADRKTPIAVSTIKAAEIQAKIGTADVTQLLVNTPSVYVAGQSGGYGDSRITVRGFQQDNTAFLLNGQPINGMEDGKMYWSNWSGMADIANVIQIQRGLGSSKLAISSVGGTVNFVTKATDKKEGGFTSFGVANNQYFKSTAGYNTGIMENGFGASVMLSHWQGDGYNDGTEGQGQNYFISFGYKANEKHSFNFLLTGAPQYHDQNFTKAISTYLEYGRRYNNNWGTLNGVYRTERRNFYHKPVANLNWDYEINDKTSLSTVLYASWGRGGGTGGYGRSVRTSTGNIDFDAIYANNQTAPGGIGNFSNTPRNYVVRSSMNNHAWYGMVTNLKKELSDNLSLNLGIDLRTYNGDHYRQVSSYLGLNGWNESRNLRDNTDLPTSTVASNTVNEGFSTNPWSSFFNTAADNQKIDYNYSETISYGGLFGQLEYAKDNFSAFFQGSLSNQSHQRFDYYDYLPEFSDSKKVSNIGYNVKGGTSYVVAEQHSFYANAGLYSRQPYHDNIYLNFTNALNPLTSNEDVLGFEAGYGFKSRYFSANLNLYRTSWKNRVTSTSGVLTAATTIGTTDLNTGDLVYTSSQNDEQLHSGVELDFVFRPLESLDIKGFASVGNWQYKGNAVQRKFDENQNLLEQTNTDIDGGKVGDAAQTTLGLGVKYKIVKNFSIDADWRNYDNLYANVAANKENIELPSYDLVDAGISYRMLVGENNKNSIDFRINMNNVFNEVYLSEITQSFSSGNVNGIFPANDTDPSYKGINVKNSAFFGLGRTWNVSIKYNF